MHGIEEPAEFTAIRKIIALEVKNLGVIFDSDNSFDNHVAKVCRACYYHLRDLR